MTQDAPVGLAILSPVREVVDLDVIESPMRGEHTVDITPAVDNTEDGEHHIVKVKRDERFPTLESSQAVMETIPPSHWIHMASVIGRFCIV